MGRKPLRPWPARIAPLEPAAIGRDPDPLRPGPRAQAVTAVQTTKLAAGMSHVMICNAIAGDTPRPAGRSRRLTPDDDDKKKADKAERKYVEKNGKDCDGFTSRTPTRSSRPRSSRRPTFWR